MSGPIRHNDAPDGRSLSVSWARRKAVCVVQEIAVSIIRSDRPIDRSFPRLCSRQVVVFAEET